MLRADAGLPARACALVVFSLMATGGMAGAQDDAFTASDGSTVPHVDGDGVPRSEPNPYRSPSHTEEADAEAQRAIPASSYVLYVASGALFVGMGSASGWYAFQRRETRRCAEALADPWGGCRNPSALGLRETSARRTIIATGVLALGALTLGLVLRGRRAVRRRRASPALASRGCVASPMGLRCRWL